MGSLRISGIAFTILVIVFITGINALPAIDAMGGVDFIQVCLNNCAQCKQMLGSYFQGQMCAESCLKFKGKHIPDCEDVGSIAQFLNSFD